MLRAFARALNTYLYHPAFLVSLYAFLKTYKKIRNFGITKEWQGSGFSKSVYSMFIWIAKFTVRRVIKATTTEKTLSSSRIHLCKVNQIN